MGVFRNLSNGAAGLSLNQLLRRNHFLLPIAFALVALGWGLDLAQLPGRGVVWTNLTALLLLLGAGLAFSAIAFNWAGYLEMPRSLERDWMRREFGFILVAEIVFLYSLACRTGNARFTEIPALLSSLGLLILACAVICHLLSQQTRQRQAALGRA